MDWNKSYSISVQPCNKKGCNGLAVYIKNGSEYICTKCGEWNDGL